MKKSIALFLTAGVLLMVTACSGDDTPKTPFVTSEYDLRAEQNTSETTATTAAATTVAGDAPSEATETFDVSGMSFEDTKLYAATYDIMSSDEFTIISSGEHIGSMTMMRSGDNMRIEMGFGVSVVVDGKIYALDVDNDIWYYTELDLADLADLAEAGIGAEMFNPDNLTLLGAGRALFAGEEMYFKDYEELDTRVRYFFCDDGKVVGSVILSILGNVLGIENLTGQELNISLSASVPDDAFNVPDDAKTYEEYMDWLLSQHFDNEP
jgi:hypothetical protein